MVNRYGYVELKCYPGANEHEYLYLCIRTYVYVCEAKHAEEDSGEFHTTEVEVRDKLVTRSTVRGTLGYYHHKDYRGSERKVWERGNRRSTCVRTVH